MPAPDLAALIASLPPIVFTSATEAPFAPTREFLILYHHGWAIAYQTENDGWALDTGNLIDPPLICAALPPTPDNLKHLLAIIAQHIGAGRFDQAAKLIDELADTVRAVRDSSLPWVADRG
jgi:hypothetical protein